MSNNSDVEVSHGVQIGEDQLKALSALSDRPGLIYLAKWFGLLLSASAVLWLVLDTVLAWPAMVLLGTILCVPAASLSHQAIHGTAFKTLWLNEVVLWVTSLIYIQEPLHRRFTHANHHAYTGHVGVDAEMRYESPLDTKGWLLEISGLGLLWYQIKSVWLLALPLYSYTMVSVIPKEKLNTATWNARIYLAIYAAIWITISIGNFWLLWFLVLPRLLGGPAMQMFALIQHTGMQENAATPQQSTRSYTTTTIGQFLCLNSNFLLEHHLFPQIPAHSLPDLNRAVADQLPRPDDGFFNVNQNVLQGILDGSGVPATNDLGSRIRRMVQ